MDPMISLDYLEFILWDEQFDCPEYWDQLVDRKCEWLFVRPKDSITQNTLRSLLTPVFPLQLLLLFFYIRGFKLLYRCPLGQRHCRIGHCRMFSSIPELYPLGPSSIPPSLIWGSKHISRYHQMSSERKASQLESVI